MLTTVLMAYGVTMSDLVATAIAVTMVTGWLLFKVAEYLHFSRKGNQ